jgi:glucose-6-phosphate 1-epimerase
MWVADTSRATTQVRVTGLQGVTYTDSLKGGERVTEAGEAVMFDQEVDRVYLGVPSTIQVSTDVLDCLLIK